ncbi:hypothetical protein TWF281_000290 [Arthrobotrys megalospora]
MTTPSFASLTTAVQEAVSSEQPVFLQFDAIDQPLADEFISFVSTGEFERRHLRVSYDSHLRQLSINMPHYIHESTGDFVMYLWEGWEDVKLLPPDAADSICRLSSPTVSGFVGRYEGSSKEPDYFLAPLGASFPSVVFETGFPESGANLITDKDLWIQGSGGATKAVILIHIIRRPDTGTGYEASLEVWRTTDCQRVVVFPDLLDEEEDPVITLGDLWGGHPVPTGCDKNQELPLPRQKLRASLLKAMRISAE